MTNGMSLNDMRKRRPGDRDRIDRIKAEMDLEAGGVADDLRLSITCAKINVAIARTLTYMPLPKYRALVEERSQELDDLLDRVPR